jgi:hypothetical protein
MPVILATPEAEISRIMIQGQHWQNVSKTPHTPHLKKFRLGGVPVISAMREAEVGGL